MSRSNARRWSQLGGVALALALTLGAGPSSGVRIDDWDAHPPGPLELSGPWRAYPPSVAPRAFKHPPAIVLDGGRPVLHLATDGEPMRLGRELKIDLTRTPWLVWEWKPLRLPDGGDVRIRRRNDQAARVMLVFEGMKGILYIWDSTAPVGVEEGPESLELFQRVLIVVRSGADGVGQWHRERRDVEKDFRRVVGTDPPPIKFVGVESHSNDTGSESAAMFGRIYFEPR